MTTLAIHELLTAAQLETARQILDSLPKNDISAATQRQYVDEVNRLLTRSDSADEVWEQLIDTTKKRSYNFRRAALKYGIRLHLHAMLYENSHGEESPGKAQTDLAFLLDILHKLDEHAGRCPLKNAKPRRSKKQALKGFPDGWRLALYKHLLLQKDNKYALPLAVTAITGCRPHELQTGVELQVKDGVLTCKILGAKVKDLQGQPERHISYEIGSNSFVEALVNAFAREGNTLVQVTSADAFRQALKRGSRVLWPRKEAATPYCLRHAAASDFKACMSEEEVSAALGHFSADTKRLYGQRQMSRGAGAMRPIAVKAARSIKTPKAHRLRNRCQF